MPNLIYNKKMNNFIIFLKKGLRPFKSLGYFKTQFNNKKGDNSHPKLRCSHRRPRLYCNKILTRVVTKVYKFSSDNLVSLWYFNFQLSLTGAIELDCFLLLRCSHLRSMPNEIKGYQ